jgi:hypothetical protein
VGRCVVGAAADRARFAVPGPVAGERGLEARG